MSAAASENDVAEGWRLAADSWSFHRQFYRRVGRPTLHREYSDLLWQIRRGAECVHVDHRAGSMYRVTLRTGEQILVQGGAKQLYGVQPVDWQPPPPTANAPVKTAPAAPAKAAAAAEPEPAPPAKPARPLKATTLTLGSPAAARALAERLRRMGVPVDPTTGRPQV